MPVFLLGPDFSLPLRTREAGRGGAGRTPTTFRRAQRILERAGRAMGNRFVVQEHTTAEGVHWDLMIEKGEALLTFRLSEGPEDALDHPVTANRISDHALRFLTYEGPVQKGAGQVRIIERGTYRFWNETADRIAMDLEGALLQGGFLLTRRDGAVWELVSDDLVGAG
jgi:hypothetical protein